MAVQYIELEHDRFFRLVHQMMHLKYRRKNPRIHQEIGRTKEINAEVGWPVALQTS
jgi:hypothetical protein